MVACSTTSGGAASVMSCICTSAAVLPSTRSGTACWPRQRPEHKRMLIRKSLIDVLPSKELNKARLSKTAQRPSAGPRLILEQSLPAEVPKGDCAREQHDDGGVGSAVRILAPGQVQVHAEEAGDYDEGEGDGAVDRQHLHD